MILEDIKNKYLELMADKLIETEEDVSNNICLIVSKNTEMISLLNELVRANSITYSYLDKIQNNDVRYLVELFCIQNSIEIIDDSINERFGNYDVVKQYFMEIKNIVSYTPLEEKEIFTKYRETHDLKLRNEIVEHNLKLVVSIAKKHCRYNNTDIFMDIIASGNLGLFNAIERFDPDKGFKFSTYAIWWITQSISRNKYGVTGPITLPYYIMDKVKKYLAITEQHRNSPLSDEELMDILDVESEKLEKIKDAANIYKDGVISMDSPVNKGDEQSDMVFGDICADDGISVEEEIEGKIFNREMFDFLRRNLEDKDLTLICMRFGIGYDREYSFAEISKELGLSRQRIQRIMIRIFKDLRLIAKRRDKSLEGYYQKEKRI